MAESIGEPRHGSFHPVGVTVHPSWMFENKAWVPLVTPEGHEPPLLPIHSFDTVGVGTGG